MKFMISLLLTCLIVPASFSDADEEPATITINISNLRNDEGLIAALLFSSSDGFPDDEDKAVLALTSSIENGEAIIEFTGVQHGEYAVSIIHDQDMNKSMNTNFVGAPTEGYWISNNERGGVLGGPNYDNAAFTVSTPSIVLIAHFDY